MSLLNLCPMIRLYETNNAGAPLAGGAIYTAQPGTVAGPGQSFPKATYTDSTGNTANANPTILGGDGKADMWLNGNYSMAVYDSTGILIESNSNVSGAGASGSPNGIDNVSFYDATLATQNVGIPAANTNPAPIVIVKTDVSANLVTITPTTGTILGQASYSLYEQNESVRLVPQVATNDWKKGA